MITVTPTAGGAYSMRDFVAFIDGLIFQGSIVNGSNTSTSFTMTWLDDNDFTVTGQVTGTGFTYGFDTFGAFLNGGTITFVTGAVSGVLQGSISMSLDAANIRALVVAENNGDRTAIERFFLAQSWNYTSGSGAENMPEGTLVADGAVFNPTGDDIFTLSNLADVFFSGDGNDVMYGLGGNDDLSGGEGNDFLDGGAGADALKGGGGFDYAAYITATAAVTASLIGSGNAGDALGDTYNSIEGLWGSGFSDALIGDAGGNALIGGAGFDYLAGGLGHDYIDGGLDWDFIEAGDGFDFVTGGDGNDTWSAVSAVMGATVYLYETTNQVLNDGFGNNESLASIEGLYGSQFGDVFVGSNNADTLTGWLGNDVIFGAGGNDVITGGPGSDYIDPGEGFDFIVWDQADFVAGEYDALAGFSSSATSYDTLYFTGLTRSDLSIIDFQGDAFISTQALNFAGAIVVQGATAAQVEAQLLFA